MLLLAIITLVLSGITMMHGNDVEKLSKRVAELEAKAADDAAKGRVANGTE